MQSLNELCKKYEGIDCLAGTDKNSVHSYIEIYEQILAPYRFSAKNILEIGILGGHSIRMWESYFISAKVHGVDLCTNPLGMFDLKPMVAEGTHHLHFFDATDAEQVHANLCDSGGKIKFDVIIEDASHAFAHTMAIYYNLKPYLAEGGTYVIEDVADIDLLRPAFERIDADASRKVTILDRRRIKNRFDDVLVIIK